MGLTELEYDHLYDYAAFSRYPTGSSKNQRRIIRRKCIEHFRAEDGVLYYSAVGTTQVSESASSVAPSTGVGRWWYGRRKKGEGSLSPAIPAPMVSA